MPSAPEVSGVFRHVRIGVRFDLDISFDAYGAYPNYLEEMVLPLVFRYNRKDILLSAGRPVCFDQPVLGLLLMSSTDHAP